MKFEWDKIAKQGIFAALFISLLYYTISENKAREADYQKTIKDVTRCE